MGVYPAVDLLPLMLFPCWPNPHSSYVSGVICSHLAETGLLAGCEVEFAIVLDAAVDVEALCRGVVVGLDLNGEGDPLEIGSEDFVQEVRVFFSFF